MTEIDIKFKSNSKNISLKSKEKNEENISFVEFLKNQNSEKLDSLVFNIQNEITKTIDCTLCGNCCKSLMINVEPNDITQLSSYLKMKEEVVKEKYLETSGTSTLAIMNKIPCHFLNENKCTVYEARPSECRVFPGLDLPHFQKRLFAFFIHYETCPIVYYSIEMLKTKLNFK